ncbi:MAG: vitamin K epoxide reductase family protein [Nitrospirota bacterium]
MNANYLSSLLFLIVGVLSSLYLLLEAVLQSFGRSICATEGCKVVSQYTRFGDFSMVLLGLGAVAVITVFAARGMRSVSEARDRTINFLLIVSLAGEGFLVGYQLFRLNAVCIFCLSVFGIFLVLGILRVLSGHREVLAGFGALAAVLALFYLVLPAGGTALPRDAKYVLFYSPDCKHCTEIRKELEEKKIEVRHVEVKEYAPLLTSLGIEHVPTLLVNGKYEKYFLTGIDAIRAHLGGVPAPAPAAQPSKKTPAAAGVRSKAAGPLDLFAPSAAPNPLFNPLPDEGLCKEDVKCD